MSQSSKSAVIHTAAQRNKSKPKAVKAAVESNQTSAVTAVIVAAALGTFLFWRKRRNDTGSASTRPGGGKAGSQSAKANSSRFPRNKAAAGNKKKDKLRKREERERRADKREQQANKPQAQAQSEQREPDPNNDKLILNYNHYVPNV